MSYVVAVVGATGNVGQEMLNILEELNFPVSKLHALASRKSKGVELAFGDRTVKCEDLETFDFSTVARRGNPVPTPNRACCRQPRSDRRAPRPPSARSGPPRRRAGRIEGAEGHEHVEMRP